MGSRHVIGFTLVGIIALLVLPALGLNIWQMIRYSALSKLHGPASGGAKAAWIVSVVAWWTGPLILIGAPLGIVLGVIHLRSRSETSRLAASMAVFNGVFISVFATILILVALWAVGKI